MIKVLQNVNLASRRALRIIFIHEKASIVTMSTLLMSLRERDKGE